MHVTITPDTRGFDRVHDSDGVYLGTVEVHPLTGAHYASCGVPLVADDTCHWQQCNSIDCTCQPGSNTAEEAAERLRRHVNAKH